MRSKIFITGFMATGKSTTGRILARTIGYKFIDTDYTIVKQTGKTIAEIFEEEGEEYFRELEERVIESLAAAEGDFVISLGGGAILSNKNLQTIKRHGALISLTADIDTILERSALSPEKRPLLVEKNRAEIETLLKSRMSYYEKGDFIVDTSGREKEEIADLCLALIDGITVKLERKSYDILIDENIYDFIPCFTQKYTSQTIISSKKIFDLHGKKIADCLKNPNIILLEEGEENKNINTIEDIYNQLLEKGVDRYGLIIALGGGVIGDMSGFVASTYQRGIAFVQFPTTLLAAVDSSIGGKTGINHEKGKNLIGTFYQPNAVFIDPTTIKTLPERELKSGIAEVIKYGVIYDRNFFDYLKENSEQILAGDLESLEYIINCAAAIKADVVAADEQEQHLRAVLNFGHTVGHALETITNYKQYTHGETVAIGMAIVSKIALSLDMCYKSVVDEITSILELYSLPTTIPADTDLDKLMKIMHGDKKAKGNIINFILPKSIGEVAISSVDESVILKVLQEEIKVKAK